MVTFDFRGLEVIATLNMQSIRDSILSYVRVRGNTGPWLFTRTGSVVNRLSRQMCASTGTSLDQIMDRVVGLVKKFDKIDADKVTETSDFQKDLSLDSLDRVELVMAFETEFSIEIPEEKADKLTCCADVAKYIAEEKTVE
ncbi:Acyl carrier protein [Melia azedarach]|uniref:Acyl carrier protein n=1 Tax=Melia azedarach TaxID=155640 RepID=A0ACC1WYL5_MELAZ|nr:Acyl carrier protein [Melia azedarach]